MSPSQKVGIERATIAPSVIAWSKIEYWRTALTIPVVRPSTTAAWTTRRVRYARIAGPRYGPVREVTSAIPRRGRGARATGVDGARSHQVAPPSAVTRERH